MEIMLSHLGVGMAYIASMGWILFMQKKGLWQQLIHAAAGCEKLFFTLGGVSVDDEPAHFFHSC